MGAERRFEVVQSQPQLAKSVIGRQLVARGLASDARVAEAEFALRRHQIGIVDGLRKALRLNARDIAALQAEGFETGTIDPVKHPADPRLVHQYGALAALKHGILPWRRMGKGVIVLTSQPDVVEVHLPGLKAHFGDIRIAICTQDDLETSLARVSSRKLVATAETLTPEHESVRPWATRATSFGVLTIAALILSSYFAGMALLYMLFGLVLTSFLAIQSLRLIAGITALRSKENAPHSVIPHRFPIVSILVPLYREKEIASALLERLGKLEYPVELLDVCLLLEDNDTLTAEALKTANIPRWMRQITVPKGTLRTKPRALNYGLKFTKGAIIGVYDAEDAPEADQINKVVHNFAARSEKVACLQGILDFYNSEQNFLSRQFTVEYSTWFRMVLPGLERLGLVLPLGGTTLFFRRHAIEELGGWDAHNVTEDADLGIRLARHGYRTELIPTVTWEEANCQPLPWIKQRSRWLKGYAMTYGAHMRNPIKLWRDLGAWKFFGVQALFFGTICQFTLAPLMWSFWAMALGMSHPLDPVMPAWGPWAIGTFFLGFEIANITLSAMILARSGKHALIRWAPLGMVYFPLATAAMYKAIWEIFFRPFYWNKTAHGVFKGY